MQSENLSALATRLSDQDAAIAAADSADAEPRPANDDSAAAEPPKPRTRFMHIRAPFPDGTKPIRKMDGRWVLQTRDEIVATICSVETGDGLVLIGMALRHSADTPSRKRGCTIAEGRARKQRGHLSWCLSLDEAKEFVQQARFELETAPYGLCAEDKIKQLDFLARPALPLTESDESAITLLSE